MTTTLKSPVAPCLWPALVTPSVFVPPGGTAKVGDKGRYSTTLLLDPEKPAHAEFMDRVRTAYDEACAEILAGDKRAKIADMPLEEEIDKETDEETGMWLLKTARGAGGISERTGKEWSSSIGLFNAEGEKYVHDETKGDLANGSLIRVEFEINAYKAGKTHGVSFRLIGAQIVRTKYRAVAAASTFGGDAVSDEDFADMVGDDGGDF